MKITEKQELELLKLVTECGLVGSYFSTGDDMEIETMTLMGTKTAFNLFVQKAKNYGIRFIFSEYNYPCNQVFTDKASY